MSELAYHDTVRSLCRETGRDRQRLLPSSLLDDGGRNCVVISWLQVACSKLDTIPVYGVSVVGTPAIPVRDAARAARRAARRASAPGVEQSVALAPSHKPMDCLSVARPLAVVVSKLFLLLYAVVVEFARCATAVTCRAQGRGHRNYIINSQGSARLPPSNDLQTPLRHACRPCRALVSSRKG